ncbi:MAG: hypothetical protein H7Y04_03230 [Verrucomicrobia bacterium]|nr:hypothetical protein [Cytophagales bacterium]
MKKILALIILFALLAMEGCRYQPQSQTWHPRSHGPISTKKPRAYRR